MLSPFDGGERPMFAVDDWKTRKENSWRQKAPTRKKWNCNNFIASIKLVVRADIKRCLLHRLMMEGWGAEFVCSDLGKKTGWLGLG